MQKTSGLYKEIISGAHLWEMVLAIGETETVLGTATDSITFGGLEILLDTGGTDTGYTESDTLSLTTSAKTFGGDGPQIGCCAAKTLQAEVLGSLDGVPRMARVIPWVRCTDGQRASEWLQKGVYYIDTRETRNSTTGGVRTQISCFDGMLRLDAPYPPSNLDWPARDKDVLHEICNAAGLTINPETEETVNGTYSINYPGEYNCRETLGFIAGMYAGCFVLDDLGRLRLVTLEMGGTEND